MCRSMRPGLISAGSSRSGWLDVNTNILSEPQQDLIPSAGSASMAWWHGRAAMLATRMRQVLAAGCPALNKVDCAEQLLETARCPALHLLNMAGSINICWGSQDRHCQVTCKVQHPSQRELGSVAVLTPLHAAAGATTPRHVASRTYCRPP